MKLPLVFKTRCFNKVLWELGPSVFGFQGVNENTRKQHGLNMCLIGVAWTTHLQNTDTSQTRSFSQIEVVCKKQTTFPLKPPPRKHMVGNMFWSNFQSFFLKRGEKMSTHDVQKTSIDSEEKSGGHLFGSNLFFYPMTDPWDDCIPGTCLSSILVVEPSKTRSFPIKTRGPIWVPGIYTP